MAQRSGEEVKKMNSELGVILQIVRSGSQVKQLQHRAKRTARWPGSEHRLDSGSPWPTWKPEGPVAAEDSQK